MKSVAIVFTHSPHGSSAGREGLDALLAVSALSEDIGVFFVGDGVFQLQPNQQPEKILSRNYIATFGVLPLYDITDCFVCAVSLRERGLSQSNDVLEMTLLDPQALRIQLQQYQQILTF